MWMGLLHFTGTMLAQHYCLLVTNQYLRLSLLCSGYGGVYKAMNVEAETMNAARQASKMAIFEDESLQGDAETRKERDIVQIMDPPLNPFNISSEDDSQRFQRDANVSISFSVEVEAKKNIIVQLGIMYFELLLKPVHFRHTNNRPSTGRLERPEPRL